jgi:hypothetical protein
MFGHSNWIINGWNLITIEVKFVFGFGHGYADGFWEIWLIFEPELGSYHVHTEFFVYTRHPNRPDESAPVPMLRVGSGVRYPTRLQDSTGYAKVPRLFHWSEMFGTERRRYEILPSCSVSFSGHFQREWRRNRLEMAGKLGISSEFMPDPETESSTWVIIYSFKLSNSLTSRIHEASFMRQFKTEGG